MTNQEAMPFNKNFAKTDSAALSQMMAAATGNNNANKAGAGGQDIFYPRQKKGGVGQSPGSQSGYDEESKQPKSGGQNLS